VIWIAEASGISPICEIAFGDNDNKNKKAPAKPGLSESVDDR